MNPPTSIRRHDRWQRQWPPPLAPDHCEFTGPDGRIQIRPAFRYVPYRFDYNRQGYEQTEVAGPTATAVRFTPELPGKWTWQARQGEEIVDAGGFECVAGPEALPGWIGISPHDSRYFCHSTGEPYVPVGLNLCWPQSFPLSSGTEFGLSSQSGTLGVAEYDRWFARLAAAGANYARLWLGAPYFRIDTQTAGEVDDRALSRLDAVIARARHHGIRLKLCLEHFRLLRSEHKGALVKTIRHPADGREPADLEEWFTSPEWRRLWLQKITVLTDRHGDDPIIFSWELWNEINCCETVKWETIREWTRAMLGELKLRSPRTLVTNSLGSLDCSETLEFQRDFQMDEMSFQQVHRYLDQGAQLEICQRDPVAASIDAIQCTRRPDRPVLLAETGAVNDCHSGPFRYYRWDDDGLIFHDVTYPPFFAGAAGGGQIWHWDQYVDQKNLWAGFSALNSALEGVRVDQEYFEPLDLSTPKAWIRVLNGRNHVLGWVRNKADGWEDRLRNLRPETIVSDLTITLPSGGHRITDGQLFRPWPQDAAGKIKVRKNQLQLPPFTHGLIFRAIKAPQPDTP